MTTTAGATTRSLADVLEDQRVGILVTFADGLLDARPMTVAAHEDRTVWFLAARDPRWTAASESDAPCALVFMDERHGTYSTLHGELDLTHDPDTIERIWSAPARAAFDGPADPSLVALRMTVTGGQWWEGPHSRIGQAVALAAATLSGDPTRLGESGHVDPTT